MQRTRKKDFCSIVSKIFPLSGAYTREKPEWDLVHVGKSPQKHGLLEHSLFKALKVGSSKMDTAPEYSTGEVQDGDRRCKESILDDLVHLTPVRIALMDPP